MFLENWDSKDQVSAIKFISNTQSLTVCEPN